MKVAVFGGGGLRTPLLLSALDRSGLGFREAALYDPDEGRLAALLPVLRAAAPGLAVTGAADPAEAARGSRFVVLAIRVGGQEARAADERACLEAGAVGQETVGAAGAALAFRNLPAALDLARTVEREAPDALVVNYTNPAGMVSEALANGTGARVVGVCDTPAALADRVAGLVGAAPGRYSVSWSGVNHLGWLTRLYAPRDCSVSCPAHLSAPSPDEPPLPPEDRLAGLFGAPERLRSAHPPGLFEPGDFRGAVPSEYVFFALHPDRAVERARAAGTTRGRQVLELEARLFSALRPSTRADGDAGPAARGRSPGSARRREAPTGEGCGEGVAPSPRKMAGGIAQRFAPPARGKSAPPRNLTETSRPPDLERKAGRFSRGLLRAYRETLAEREATYFGIEAGGGSTGAGTAGGGAKAGPEGGAGLAPSGYDRIGLAVIRAALAAEEDGGNGGADGAAEIVLNTRNRTAAGGPAVPELPTDDFVEAPARVGRDGAVPSPQPPLPVEAGRLLRRVKACEREITAAAVSGDAGRAAEALREHPAGGAAAAEVFSSLTLR